MKLKSLRLRLCTWPFSLPAEEDEEDEEELVEEEDVEEEEEECGATCWSSVSASWSRSSPAKSVGGDGWEK